MKKRFTHRAVSLSLLVLLIAGLLMLTGCTINNPANGNLKTNRIGEDGEPILDKPIETQAPDGTGTTTGPTDAQQTTEAGETKDPAETDKPAETGDTVQLVDVSALSDEVKMSFFDYVKLPFSYLLRWLYDLTGSYGLALILFALLIKIILLPASAKSKKGMMKMSRLTPKVKALEAQYGDDKQGYQTAVNQLYREEGAGGCGGCIWSLLPLLLLIPLYEIIREPITWLMFHGNVSQKTLGEIQNVLLLAKHNAPADSLIHSLELTGAYWQMMAIPHLTGDVLKSVQAIDPAMVAMNTRFLGVELATVPKVTFWKNFDSGVWNAIGQFLLPLISGGINMVTMWLSQKMNNTVIVNDKGEKDDDMAKQNKTNKAMTYMMPLMSVYIGFVAPAGLSLYWITQGVFSMIQDYFLTKHYKKIYDAEDAVKQAQAAEEAKREAERARQRQQRMAENPDGMVGSVSKKKQQQREKNEQAAKEAAYLEKVGAKKAEEERPEETKQDESRPNRRGRNYDPHRYSQVNQPKAEEDASGSEGADKE